MDKTNPMLELADRYSDELTAQFRTLNFFVQHAGEIGRAHETYIRGIINRFLPGKCSTGTGFVVSEGWTSTQQNIIIYTQHDLPTLFMVGDCVVVDKDAVAGVIEVKTSLKSKKQFLETYKKSSDIYKQFGGSRFVGLYIWDGLSLDYLLESIWEYIRENPLEYLHNIPSLIYVQNQYLLMHNLDGRRESAPFRLLLISKDGVSGVSEGQALLTLMTEIWIDGLQSFAKWPWWINDWWRRVPALQDFVQWPPDLQKRIDDSLE